MLLLQLLDRQEDYGYSVVVRLQHHGFEGLAEGSVYPALTRLEKRGLLTSRLVASDSGPARKYYQPTEEGRAELARSAEAWHALGTRVDRVMAPTSTSNPEKRAS